MSAFNQILLDVHPELVDFDAVDHTAKIANKTHSAVKVLHVVEDYPEDLSEWWNVRNPVRLYDQIVAKRQSCVDNIVKRIQKSGVEQVEAGMRWGRKVDQVTQEAVNYHQELVGTSGYPPTGRLSGLRGGCSCIAGLCRHCPSSIWVTRNKLSQLKRTVVALHADQGHVQVKDLNAKMLQAAAAIAEAEGSELHFVHAFSLNEGRGLMGKRLLVDLAEFADNLRNEIKQECDTLLEDTHLRLNPHNIHLLMGSPATMIPEFVQAHDMDLVVMGTGRHKTIPGLVVGNISEKVLNRVACSVLMVKPDDFVPPMFAERGKLNAQQAA